MRVCVCVCATRTHTHTYIHTRTVHSNHSIQQIEDTFDVQSVNLLTVKSIAAHP